MHEILVSFDIVSDCAAADARDTKMAEGVTSDFVAGFRDIDQVLLGELINAVEMPPGSRSRDEKRTLDPEAAEHARPGIRRGARKIVEAERDDRRLGAIRQSVRRPANRQSRTDA